MTNAVRIKNTSEGMTVYLNQELEFDVLLSEIDKKFGESAKFFGNAKTVLSLKGRELTEDEEGKIIQVISDATSLDIVCLMEDTKEEPLPEPIKEEVPMELPGEERVFFHKKSVSPGEIIKADKDLVILGNVAQGATLISTNSIFVYGGLYGEAYAGVDNGNDFVITALDFAPEKIGIGRLEYIGKKAPKWKLKSHFDAQIAYVRDKKIKTEQITKELLNSLV